MKRNAIEAQERQIELLENLSVILLARIGVPQNTIKKLVGIDSNRVNQIARFIPAQERSKNGK